MGGWVGAHDVADDNQLVSRCVITQLQTNHGELQLVIIVEFRMRPSIPHISVMTANAGMSDLHSVREQHTTSYKVAALIECTRRFHSAALAQS
jgi:hypothetical protein